MSAEPDRRPVELPRVRRRPDRAEPRDTDPRRVTGRAARRRGGRLVHGLQGRDRRDAHGEGEHRGNSQRAPEPACSATPATILVSRTKTGQFSPLDERAGVPRPGGEPGAAAHNRARRARPRDWRRRPGVVPQTSRRPTDPDAVDLGSTPSRAGTSGSASHRGRGPSPGSARHMALPPEARQTPATPGQTKRIPAPAPAPLPIPPSDSGEPPFADMFSNGEPVDPQADTELYVPAVPGTAPQEPVEEEPPQAKNAVPFDWTPILVVLVIASSPRWSAIFYSIGKSALTAPDTSPAHPPAPSRGAGTRRATGRRRQTRTFPTPAPRRRSSRSRSCTASR